MQVFDFDKTIYKNDSSTDFYFYCLLTHPYIILLLPYQAALALLWAAKLISRGRFKAGFFSYIRFIPKLEGQVESFWRGHKKNIFYWYLQAHTDNDIVISASPRFLLEGICKELGVKTLLATEMDAKSGKISGENCYGAEKVKRFRQCFPNAKVAAFYSDSYSDQPMADIAEKSYLIKKGRVCPWK